ncbi:hypothetical protein BDV96DRAFT_569529 [Lophiotrema nucula]|uniref:DUF3752 domain-containing protein n=1 Tax=Lophiotrema nucula TaxID=690887 RepID=A0A6A5ZIV0_9PLEO|nr:hypothetical protein BDV96DRAFT_569529 [Lophiotrema nucula]
MSSIGPTLPPHLSKRKRSEDEDASNTRSSPSRSSSPDSSEKRRRVLGPAPPPRVLGPAAPPAPLDEIPPNHPSEDSDSSSDDDFGPAPPPAGAQHAAYDDDEKPQAKSAFDTDSQYAEEAKKVQRDEWMMMPPTQDDLAARMDPTKIRARKFNTGKGGRPPAAGGKDMGTWTETPEQKLKRLQNEALGISAPSSASDAAARESRRNREQEEKARKLKERLDGVRGKSLVEQHKEKSSGKEKEDDPSKRVFDYEKDMGTGMKISSKQRNEMLNKAKGFGDRFSSGNYL